MHNPRRLGPSAGEPCSRGPARNDRAAATKAYGPGAAPNLRVYSHTHKLEEVRVDGQVKPTTMQWHMPGRNLKINYFNLMNHIFV